MKNKMATLLGKAFSTIENVVSQCDDQTLVSIVETLIINFDEKMFEQLLSGGSASPLSVRKHRSIFLSRAPLVKAWKQKAVFVETSMAPCESTLALCEAQPASCEANVLRRPATVSSSETNLALSELATAPVGANLASCQVRNESLDSISCEDKIVFDCEAISTLNRAKVEACSSSEAKAEVPRGASTTQPRSRANLALLKAPAQRYTASFASSSEAKALCVVIAAQCQPKSCYIVSFTSSSETQAPYAMPCEAESGSGAILASPSTKKKDLKAKPRVSQSKWANIQFPRVSVLDWLDPDNTDLWDYLSNKRKFNSALKSQFTSCHPSADKMGINL